MWFCSVFRCYLDMVKVFVFSYFFWLVLCLIFITGTTRINIFCLGYLVACFYFMLFGSSVLMQPVRYILRLWDWLIGYTCFVIAMKNLLSVSDRGEKVQMMCCCLSKFISVKCSFAALCVTSADVYSLSSFFLLHTNTEESVDSVSVTNFNFVNC